MNPLACLTIRFLQPYFHGRNENGEPEWPPSPLRAFQALVEAAASRWRGALFEECAAPTLRWLENQRAAVIVAPAGRSVSARYRLYVPDNVADKVAGSWSGGREASIADYRTEKDVRPTVIDGEAVHYLFAFDSPPPNADVLRTAARSITHLGWGVDMVAGDAAILSGVEAEKLPGERWIAADGADGYRVPAAGTLDALLRKHEAFLNRLVRDGRGEESFSPVPPLPGSAFRIAGYRRAGDPSPPRFAAFKILTPDGSGWRPFDPVRRTRDIAGWLRHAVAAAAERQRPFGWTDAEINAFVHGKTPDGSGPARTAGAPERFTYLPLPSITPLRVESTRRVLIAAPAHRGDAIAWLRLALNGARLRDEAGGAPALLAEIPKGSDEVVKKYVAESQTWSTVTPVILPGHDDRDPAKAEKLFWTAFQQAGLTKELLAGAVLDWRKAGFFRGVDLASRYLPPKNLDRQPRYHVRVTFARKVPGPLVIGSGRFRGFGLFAAEPSS